MTMKDANPAQRDRMAAEMETALGELVTGFVAKHGLSSLSITTLALQVLIAGLMQIGGPQALVYTNCVIDGQITKDDRQLQKINRRAKQAMKRMAAHYDGLLDARRKQVMQ